MLFQPIVENQDLSVHPDPPGRWDCVAVVCLWKDAHTRRRKWPHAAVVGPLRSIGGIDELLRNLLANPQIRYVVVDGTDLTPGKVVEPALANVWGLAGASYQQPIAAKSDVLEHVGLIQKGVQLMASTFNVADVPDLLSDRPGGKVVLAPPKPEATAAAPHGDPGERVAGDNLVDVWPVVLDRIMKFGRRIPSQYGDTMEILNLVSVFRDPAAVAAMRPPEWMPLTSEAIEEYIKQATTDWAPDDAPYSYGTKIGQAGFDSVSRLLVEKPSDRGIAVSPWTPADAHGASGRPCLVWSQFRAVNGALHLQFIFRSHDYFRAYPQNVAALCSWLVREAVQADLSVGTATCLSVSAHVYDRNWDDARRIARRRAPRGHQWDSRSEWRVHTREGRIWVTAYAAGSAGASVVGAFDGKTAEGIQHEIERSGLVTSIGNAIWLGRELARAQHELTREK